MTKRMCSSRSTPSSSFPCRMSSRLTERAKALSFSLFLTDLTSSHPGLVGRTKARHATRKPQSSSVANSARAIAVSRGRRCSAWPMIARMKRSEYPSAKYVCAGKGCWSAVRKHFIIEVMEHPHQSPLVRRLPGLHIFYTGLASRPNCQGMFAQALALGVSRTAAPRLRLGWA